MSTYDALSNETILDGCQAASAFALIEQPYTALWWDYH